MTLERRAQGMAEWLVQTYVDGPFEVDVVREYLIGHLKQMVWEEREICARRAKHCLVKIKTHAADPLCSDAMLQRIFEEVENAQIQIGAAIHSLNKPPAGDT